MSTLYIALSVDNHICYTMSMGYSKYGNKTTEYNGRSFMSKKEAGYARTLDALKYAKDPK